MHPYFSFISILMLALSQVQTQQYKWTTDTNKGDQKQSAAFTDEEKYLDIFPLTIRNFTDSVLKGNKDPWIVIFHDGTMNRAWKTMAVHLRGIVWIGMIDNTTETKLLKDINYNSVDKEEARVYPYGGLKFKKDGWKTVKDPNEARIAAVKSLPDKTQRITGTDLKDFVVECYMAHPSKFPLIMAVDEEDTSGVFKALAVRFDKYFHFGRMVKPTADDYRGLGLGDTYVDTPAIFVLVQNPERGVVEDAEKMDFNAVQFDTKTMGKLSYPNILQFLFTVNSQFRHVLPLDNMSNFKMEAEMEDIIKIEDKRFEVFFSGRNQTASQDNKAPTDATDHEGLKFTTESRVGGQSKDEL